MVRFFSVEAGGILECDGGEDGSGCLTIFTELLLAPAALWADTVIGMERGF